MSVKSTVEQLSPTRVRINVEVPFEELKPDFDAAYKTLAQQIRLPGFRPGKAPARLLEARVGRGAVLEQVINAALPKKYSEAVTEADLRPLGQPEIEVTKLEDGQEVAFTAEIDVRPDITLPAFGELAVTVDPIEVADDDIEEQLHSLQARFGTLTGVERPVQDGDFVTLDLSATVNGEDVPEASTTGMSYEVGSGQLIEGIDQALVGMSAGDTADFTTALLAGEFAGQDAVVSAVIGTVKERELPEADDEFAQLASEFDTLDELKSDLRERVTRVKQVEQATEARDKVLEALLATTEVALPDAVVKAEVDSRLHDAVHPFDHDEEKFAASLTAQGSSREEFDASAQSESENSVKTQLLLDALAEAENTTVDNDELTERIVYQAQRYGVSPEEYIQQAQQANQLGAIFADVRRGKALAGVVVQATVTDTAGNAVDLDELLGRQPAADDGVIEGETVENDQHS
ncbi:MAG: trigger factor [Actinomycetota bacterium]|nr:trigger factor [Actinomycetota bacterium]